MQIVFSRFIWTCHDWLIALTQSWISHSWRQVYLEVSGHSFRFLWAYKPFKSIDSVQLVFCYIMAHNSWFTFFLLLVYNIYEFTQALFLRFLFWLYLLLINLCDFCLNLLEEQMLYRWWIYLLEFFFLWLLFFWAWFNIAHRSKWFVIFLLDDTTSADHNRCSFNFFIFL